MPNQQGSTTQIPPDQYRELVQKVADRVWTLMQAEQRIRAEREAAERRRRKRS